MKKEFIPYEQALELKELGFDEQCLGYYHTTLSSSDVDLVISKTPNSFYHLIRIPEHFDTLAPLYQQAFRWLKWKTGTYGYHFIYQTSGGLLGVQNIEEYYKGNKQAHGHFGPYEDAELDCIKQLIEIAKKDNR